MEKKPTDTGILPINSRPDRFRPNDIAFRVILTPFFGIAIPLITGMINPENFGHWQIKLSFLYTTGIAFIIWQGNRYLHFSLQSYFDWHKKPLRKILALFFTIVFYTVPISVVLLLGWYGLFENGVINWPAITNATLIIMICVIFITHVYETAYLVKESETEMTRSSQLERAKLEAELEALKNQVDPHFIFNSLNTLSHLIEVDPQKAKEFNDTLAEVYRYILRNKARDLVLLSEEIHFLRQYFTLLRIRFERAVQLNIAVSIKTQEGSLIAPISLQALAENAIKHNEFSDREPLLLEVKMDENEIVVSNLVRKKELRRPGPGTGLANLSERYRLVSGKNIFHGNVEGNFVVRLPLLKIN